MAATVAHRAQPRRPGDLRRASWRTLRPQRDRVSQFRLTIGREIKLPAKRILERVFCGDSITSIIPCTLTKSLDRNNFGVTLTIAIDLVGFALLARDIATHQSRLTAVVVCVATALCASGLTARPAHAGAYHVQVCRAGAGNNGVFQLGVPPEWGWYFESSMNCDGGWNGWNGLQVHVGNGPSDPTTEPAPPLNTSASLFVTAPWGATLEQVLVDSGRFASYYGRTSGWSARVSAVNRGWCVLQGDGGQACPEYDGTAADNSAYESWGGPSYAGRGTRAYGAGYGSGITQLAFGVVCSGGSTVDRCYRPAYKPAAGVAIVSADVKVRDETPPAISSISGPLTDGSWHQGGNLGYSVSASDNTGIRMFQTIVDGQGAGDIPQPCDYSALTPCSNRSLSDSVSVGGNYDGYHSVTIRAFSASTEDLDCAVDCGVTTAGAIATDSNVPAAPASANPDPGWKRTNAYALTSPLPASEADPDGAGPQARAPIVRRVATICPGTATTGEGCASRDVGPAPGGGPASASLTVPSEGPWQASIRLVDQAGNVGAPSAWIPLLLDQTPPSLSVGQARGGVAIHATDALSLMLAARGAGITYRVDGVGSWTAVDGGDAMVGMSPGQHYIEAFATDGAGNSLGDRSRPKRFDVTVPDGNGNVPQLDTIGGDSRLTVKDRGALNGSNATENATISAWFARNPRRDGPGKKVPATAPTGLTVRTLAAKGSATLAGELLNSTGAPIADARIDLTATIAGGITASSKGAATTDSRGRFTIVLKPGQTSRRLAVTWGTRVNDIQPAASANLQLIVKATAAFTAHDPHVGGRSKFTGYVSSGYLTPRGVQVSLQWRHNRRWETFDTARTDARGRWRAYRTFTRRATYRMRAFVPSSPGYAYKGNASRSRLVRVR